MGYTQADFSPQALAFLEGVASDTGLDPGVVAAWMLDEEPTDGPDNPGTGNQNWLNIGFFDTGPSAITFDAVFDTPASGAEYTARFLKGTWGGAHPGILAILNTVGDPPIDQLHALQVSGWASSGYPHIIEIYDALEPSFLAYLKAAVGKGGAGTGGTGVGAEPYGGPGSPTSPGAPDATAPAQLGGGPAAPVVSLSAVTGADYAHALESAWIDWGLVGAFASRASGQILGFVTGIEYVDRHGAQAGKG